MSIHQGRGLGQTSALHVFVDYVLSLVYGKRNTNRPPMGPNSYAPATKILWLTKPRVHAFKSRLHLAVVVIYGYGAFRGLSFGVLI